MSGAMIYQETLRILRGLNLPETAETDVIAALEVARPNSPLDVAYWATLEAKLERDESIWRAAAVFFSFAAANLADDVSDGDCHYLAPAQAPGVQFILQNLVFYCLMKTSIQPGTLRSIAQELIEMGAGQQIEVSTESWNLERAKIVAETIAGRQYAAYLQILWGETKFADQARDWGQKLGNAAQISIDFGGLVPCLRLGESPRTLGRECHVPTLHVDFPRFSRLSPPRSDPTLGVGKPSGVLRVCHPSASNSYAGSAPPRAPTSRGLPTQKR